MRLILLGAAALLLAGCGGEEYPVPASEAFATLSSVGTPEGLYPLPVGVEEVSVNFESVAAETLVKWKFSHDGDDLATIFAQVTPSGDKSSNVRFAYAEGTAPDANWHNGKIRRLLKSQVQQLVVEAVDSKFEHRPFDSKLRASVSAATATATIGKLFDDVDSSLDAEIARRDANDREKENRIATNPRNATKPSMDLSKFN